LQEVKAAAEEAAKDNTAHEKQSVSLEERRKHASAKAKKLKKALADVSFLATFYGRSCLLSFFSTRLYVSLVSLLHDNLPVSIGIMIWDGSNLSLKQDEQSKKQADNTIQDSDAKIKTKKREIAEHEANLEKEEKVLEGIRDGLKGRVHGLAIHDTILIMDWQTRRKSFTNRSRRSRKSYNRGLPRLMSNRLRLT
jgi:structural maintenance of chromosome 4